MFSFFFFWKVHQINNTELNTCAAEIWHHWFWLWAGAAAVDVVSNGFEEEEVGGLAGAGASPGLCLRRRHRSSLTASSANISHFSSSTLFFSVVVVVFLIILLSFQCLSLILQYADLHTSPLLLCIHALSTYLSVMRLWERHYAYAKSIFHSVRMLSWCHWDRFTRVLWSLSGTACMGNMGCGIWRYTACCLSLRAEGLTKQHHLYCGIMIIVLEWRCSGNTGQKEGLEAGKREETALKQKEKRENRIYCSEVDVRTVCWGGDTDRARGKSVNVSWYVPWEVRKS